MWVNATTFLAQIADSGQVTLFPSPQHFWMESLGPRELIHCPGHLLLGSSLDICMGHSPCCHKYLGDTVGDLLCWDFYSPLVSWSFLSKPRGVFFIRNCLYIPRVPLLFRLRETTLQQDPCFRHPVPLPVHRLKS